MVLAARGGEGGRKLAVAERANDGENAAGDPAGDDLRLAPHRAGHDRRRPEDPRADDQADDDPDGVRYGKRLVRLSARPRLWPGRALRLRERGAHLPPA